MKRIKKNSLLGLLLMTALFFTFSACDGCKNQTDGQGEEPKEEIQRPAKIITVADAKMMYENYTKRRAPLIHRHNKCNRKKTRLMWPVMGIMTSR